MSGSTPTKHGKRCPVAEFEFTEEHGDLRSLVRSWCERVWTPEHVRQIADAGTIDLEAWHALGSELGVVGLSLPEEYGGGGLGVIELAIVAEELGRALACLPWISSAALGAAALVASGDGDALTEWVPALASGAKTITLAGGRTRLADAITVSAEFDDDGWKLTGDAEHVPDGATADVILVLADADSGPTLFAVDGNAPGVDRHALATLDLTRRQANIHFDSTPARVIGEAGNGASAVSHALDVAATALAAEQAGIAAHMLDVTTEYAKSRIQFGRIIGSFQAVKHRLADMAAAAGNVRGAAYHAAWSHDDPSLDDPALATSIAQQVASAGAVEVTAKAIQSHGGIGFTWEHPAHLYYKRAVSNSALFGGRAVHAERIAKEVIDA
ncbi:acyl-CoA dehydrogenase [Mycobacteroides sp. H001]|uniref:acyl-CoA dehydrogenase family protein n=1 Tax=Mycobacteroides chelonae TaxID=1774 RepID=UPI0007163F5B|nr:MULTISPECIES: acyl-CoA dehydrogenase family protein [unclassified Mycobacteroides]OHU37871.1 acyl-CoA dehydrogenase [Mycobacteroides chelonae]KRQ24785.1 acyl-CoA dehydrogenase [Mycobacteroides sp. H072]KRQ37675.1 acyl-CoA dehydrogenase [Mycobacteroides sp. H002]KRQ47168.1 acyl-CoA dehydrogenase [Mycobacteroides sp. H054]KRQ69190.1 acyl-CoA dehydrogenase [Mycobacteroides sp. H001]